MAVRRRLQQFFQDPEIDGAIMVERPAAAPADSARQAAAEANTGAAALRRRRLRPQDCAVFQCRGCHAVLSDSLHLCAQEERRLHVLACFKVTEDVVLEDSLRVGIDGSLLGCTYNALYCRSCGVILGFNLYSSSSDLAYLRGFFCLFKDCILCYYLTTKTTIDGSEMTFPALNLKKKLSKLKEQLVIIHVRLEILIRRLEELNWQNMADKQGCSSRTACLKPERARIKSNN
ncbi:PREDICTED: protein Mis18-beta [Gavialis gangeticus]|uniref:protein Mis18-beta n=1 Tax=Gavialis gangeticus TaxID=94835 RepID=UPI00092E46E0|nr:PREDICTED: protein Mis18-beta [Gavialis gangeticus]